MGIHDRESMPPGVLGDAPGQSTAASDKGADVLVIIADDEAAIVELVALVIAELGHRTQTVANGRHALELARGRWPDLVVTDLMMPELSGTALIAALRAEAAAAGRPLPPVILMTAAGSSASAAVGADAVLPKPFDLATLEGLVARFLGDPGRRPG